MIFFILSIYTFIKNGPLTVYHFKIKIFLTLNICHVFNILPLTVYKDKKENVYYLRKATYTRKRLTPLEALRYGALNGTRKLVRPLEGK